MGRTIQTRDGMALVRRDWPSADARGTIVIVHGLGEHIGRYAHVAARLNANRWSVVGYDQRGDGASPGERGRIAAQDDLLVDLAAIIDAVRAEAPARWSCSATASAAWSSRVSSPARSTRRGRPGSAKSTPSSCRRRRSPSA